jgi:hypothetical protein
MTMMMISDAIDIGWMKGGLLLAAQHYVLGQISFYSMIMGRRRFQMHIAWRAGCMG